MRYQWILRDLDSNETYQLLKDPKGWSELALHIYRSETYRGIFREPTLKTLTFYNNGGGREFILAKFAQYDINAKIELRCLFDSGTGDGYQPLFTGVLAMSKNDDIDNDELSLGIEHSAIFQKILSRDKIAVDMESAVSIGGRPITPANVRSITLPGMNIYVKNQWENERTFFDLNASASVLYGGILVPDTNYVRSDFGNTYDLTYHTIVDQPPVTLDASGIHQIFSFPKNDIIGDQSGFTFNYRYLGNLSFALTGPAGQHFHITGTVSKKIAWGDALDNATIHTLFTYAFDDDMAFIIPIDEAGTGVLTLSYDDNVWSYWEISYTVTGSAFAALFQFSCGFDEQFFSLEIDTAYDPTVTKSILIHEAFQNVIDAIADSDGNLDSPFYGRTDSSKVSYSSTGEGSLKAITNGLNIRTIESPLLLTLQDLFNSADAIDNIALSIKNNKVVIGPLSDSFNRDKKLCTLPYVKKMQTSVEEGYYFNQALIGFEKWETEYKNGLEDPITQAQYSTYVNSVTNTYNKISKILASPFIIEVTRRKNLVAHSTEDWRYDNSNIWLCLNADYSVEKLADAFIAASGMTDINTAMNLRLSPERLLLAHIGVITACLQIIKGKISFSSKTGNNAFSSTKNNTGAQCDYSGQELLSNQSFDWNDVKAERIKPLWLPFSHSFETKLNPDQFAAIEADPDGFVEAYEYENDIKRGYILDMSYKLKTGLTQFKLLKRYD